MPLNYPCIIWCICYQNIPLTHSREKWEWTMSKIQNEIKYKNIPGRPLSASVEVLREWHSDSRNQPIARAAEREQKREEYFRQEIPQKWRTIFIICECARVDSSGLLVLLSYNVCSVPPLYGCVWVLARAVATAADWWIKQKSKTTQCECIKDVHCTHTHT